MALAVAHLIYGLDLGGLEQLVVQLADRSRRRGIETSIVALGELRFNLHLLVVIAVTLLVVIALFLFLKFS